MHAMTNHSCDPNCEFTASEGGRYIREFAKSDLKKDEELTISYLTPEQLQKGVEERRDLLFENFGFECVCRRCLIDVLKLDMEEKNKKKQAQQEEPAKRQKTQVK